MATNTYVALDTQTLGSAAASVTFSSIPQTYTDLVLVINGYSINDVDWRFRMGNGSIDSGSNYSGTYMYGDGSGASSYRESNVTGIGTGGAYNALEQVLYRYKIIQTLIQTKQFWLELTQMIILKQELDYGVQLLLLMLFKFLLIVATLLQAQPSPCMA
jgi:hypothetical protein